MHMCCVYSDVDGNHIYTPTIQFRLKSYYLYKNFPFSKEITFLKVKQQLSRNCSILEGGVDRMSQNVRN